MGVEDVIRQAFNEAKQYQATWKEYNTQKAAGEKRIPRSAI